MRELVEEFYIEIEKGISLEVTHTHTHTPLTHLLIEVLVAQVDQKELDEKLQVRKLDCAHSNIHTNSKLAGGARKGPNGFRHGRRRGAEEDR